MSPGKPVPPTHTRFKPGQSGNPNGRPKGSKNFKTVVEKEFSKLVTITEGGRTVRRTKLEVMMQRIAHEALKGNLRALELSFRVIRDLERGPEEQAQALGKEAAAQPSLPDAATLKRILKRFEHLQGGR